MTKDEALDLALEELENCADLLKMFDAPIDSCVGLTMLQAEEAITAIKQALAAPVPMTSESAQGVEQDERVFARIAAMKKPPAAQPAVQEPVYLVEDDFGLFRITTKGDWNFYNVTVPGVKKTLIANATPPAAQPAIPDAITDNSESPEYRTGWNDCRAAMMEMMK